MAIIAMSIDTGKVNPLLRMQKTSLERGYDSLLKTGTMFLNMQNVIQVWQKLGQTAERTGLAQLGEKDA